MVGFYSKVEVVGGPVPKNIATNFSIDDFVQIVSFEVVGIINTFVEVENVSEGLILAARSCQISQFDGLDHFIEWVVTLNLSGVESEPQFEVMNLLRDSKH